MRHIQDLKEKRLFVLDMDGTFYLGNRILDGSLAFVDKIRQSGRDLLFFTNNASKTPEFYIEKLKKMGCWIERKNIATAGDVTIEYIKTYHSGRNVFLVGTRLLEQSFKQAGIRLVRTDPDIVVVSFDTSLTYEKISDACTFIRNGALFLATHMDYNCPTEDGYIPDCGAICALVTASTGKLPKYLGKPFAETLEMIEGITGCKKQEMAVVGDRLYTDIALGAQNGVSSVLVLTGETTKEDAAHSEIRPDYIFESLKQLAEIL